MPGEIFGEKVPTAKRRVKKVPGEIFGEIFDSKKFREKLMKMNEWCRKNRHMPVREQHEKLTLKLKGHYGYYGITGNMRGLQRYLNEVKKIWKKWLSRRSWKGKRLTWDRFNRVLEEYLPLPPAKVVHSIYKRSEAII